MKTLFNALHKVVKWVAHILLIPVMVVLKALISGLEHLHDELAKV